MNLHSLASAFGPYSDNDLGGYAKNDGRPATMTNVREFAESALAVEECWSDVAAVE